MSDEAYYKLAKVLDSLPNGFPATESGVEIRLLKKIFQPDEIELFCDMKLKFETAKKIAKRTGRPLEGLEEKLTRMWEKGQISGVQLGDVKLFRMVPWVLGIYEFQLPFMDREMAEMCEEFMKVYGRQFFDKTPQLMRVIPIEKEIPARHEALNFEKVSSIIESGLSFQLMHCICKKEQGSWTIAVESPWTFAWGLHPCRAFSTIRRQAASFPRKRLTVCSKEPKRLRWFTSPGTWKTATTSSATAAGAAAGC